MDTAGLVAADAGVALKDMGVQQPSDKAGGVGAPGTQHSWMGSVEVRALASGLRVSFNLPRSQHARQDPVHDAGVHRPGGQGPAPKPVEPWVTAE